MHASGALVCRNACKTDLEAILRLYSQLSSNNPDVPEVLAQKRFDKMLDMLGLYFGVGEIEGRVVTTAVLLLVPNLTRGARPFGVIENVVTDAAMRGNGFGKTLIQYLLERARYADAYKVMLMTGRTEDNVLHFYESCGFTRGTKTAFEVRF
ncbi:MAG: hypothetical protein FD175_1418 [Beijerinckiaceae bacterium]|nr:MAG: hypothetical protein FD175_1418 [Beijerinckiaceae bacterium]